MNFHENIDRLQKFKRLGWLPVFAPGEGSLTESKCSGIPWLADEECWPCCGSCGEPMRFFFQLNLNDLPNNQQDVISTGLLQFFLCIDCDSGNAPFANTHLARIVQPNPYSSPQKIPILVSDHPSTRIIGWEPIEELFDWKELWFMGNEDGYSLPPEDILWFQELDEQVEDDETLFEQVTSLLHPDAGLKLKGWPYWEQEPRYPNCPKSQSPMTYILQVDLAYKLLGVRGSSGVGTGHICQSPVDKSILSYTCECT